MTNAIQSQLTEFYRSEFEAIRRDRTFTDKQAMELSAPYLLSVPENYLTSALKIMYVGKETNGWGGEVKNLHDFLNNEDGVDRLLRRYEHEMQDEPRWNIKYFIEYKKIRKSLTGNKKGSIVFSNLMKMDYKQKGNGYSRNSINHSVQLRELSKRFFQKELELLKPDYIIFVTSHTYDSVIKSFLPDRETIEVIEKKALWKFRSNGAVCYRTWHPQTINYKAEKTIPEYFQMIIDDIKNETCLPV